MPEIFRVFLEVLTPVFALVGIGYLAASRMSLDAATLSRISYWVLGPAFVIDILSGADLARDVVVGVVLVGVGGMILAGLVTWVVMRLRDASPSVGGATLLTSIHGNTGNFGLAISSFAFGEEALAIAGLAMVAMNTAGFWVGVSAATRRTASRWLAARTALLTPMAFAVIPAIILNTGGFELPVAISRPIALLSGALIPTMLLMLGIQLQGMGRPHLGANVVIPIAIKLAVAPAAATGLVWLYGLTGLPAAVVILQSAMPAAVFTSLIALEHDLEPDLVTTTVLAGTLISVATLPVVISLL